MQASGGNAASGALHEPQWLTLPRHATIASTTRTVACRSSSAKTVVAPRTHRASLAGRFPLSRRERGFMQERQRRTEAAVRAYERAAQRFDASRLAEASAAARDLSAAARRGDAAVVSILDHGAAGDGRGDDAAALRRAVAAAAGATAPRRVVHLPAGRTYKMSAVVLADVEDLELRIDGTIRAPPMDRWPARAEPEDETQSPELRRMRYAFLELRRAKRVAVTGSGAVEGSGRAWWRVRKRRPSVRAPVLLLVADSRDVAVTHLRLAESPFYHVVVLRSSSVALRRLRVASPPGFRKTSKSRTTCGCRASRSILISRSTWKLTPSALPAAQRTFLMATSTPSALRVALRTTPHWPWPNALPTS